MAGICRVAASSGTLASIRAAAPSLMRILLHVFTRFNATAAGAAKPLFDDDYCDYEQQNEFELTSLRGRANSAPLLGSEGCTPLRGVQWAFIGHPGAKKHVYAEKLSELLQVPHISMGSLVRQDLSPNSYLYQRIAYAVNKDKSVPEEIIFGLLLKRLEDGHCKGETGFILNGIPRTRIQAEILDKVVDIDLVVNFKCAENYLMEHQGEGHAWKEKAHIYIQQVKLLEDYYKKQNKVINFQVCSALGETWKGLLAALHL